jgi:hypothetical protein
MIERIPEEDPLDRELQATELARLMASTFPDPVIFLGYVVTKPLAKRRECVAQPQLSLLTTPS